MTRTKRIACAASLGVASLAAWILISRTEVRKLATTEDAEVQQSTLDPAAETTASDQSLALGRSMTTAPVNGVGVEDEVERPKTLLEEWREEVFEKHADIAQFTQFNRRVVKSAADRATYYKMLGDRDLIERSKIDLMASSEDYSDIEQRKRMYRVEYLGAAIQWKENPERGAAMEAIEDVIFARNIKAGCSPDQKHSLAGDKIELFWALMEHDPAQAEAVAAKAKGTEFGPLVTYARKKWDAVIQPESGGG